MNLRKSSALIIAGLISVSLFAGCKKNKNYEIYTNIPQENFEISDKNYKLASLIGGYVPVDRQFEETDTANYTPKQSFYFEMMADATLLVSADFTQSGADINYDTFRTELNNVLHEEIDAAISATVPTSDITLFNNAQAGEKIEIRQVTYEVLSEALEVYDLTDGYYNPALYYNIQAYGFGGAKDYPHNASELPSDETIAQYTDLASHFGEVALTKEEDRFFVTKPAYTVTVGEETLSMKLDLGGIGKGYAVDRVDELFDEYGYKFGYFNFGSSSMLIKSNVSAGAYNLAFSGPRSAGRDPYLTTKVREEKLSTSGDYEQYYKIDGKRYCHIIDPTTGKPVQTGIMSATVIGGSAAQADALTTAIMTMGKERAIAFIEQKLTDRKVAFVCE